MATLIATLSLALSPVSLLESFGDNSIRVRVGAPGQPSVSDPPISALLLGRQTTSHATNLTNGNLRVELDGTGLLTATRLSDGAVLLRQTQLEWAPLDPVTAATNRARAGSHAAVVRFSGVPGERVYGLGEHKTGKVQRAPYAKLFADSLYYGRSGGADVSVPYYSSSVGYAFVWNTPALGSLSLDEHEITWVANATLCVDLWVSTHPAVPAPSFHADLLKQYATAVGNPLPLPSWATGFIQCKDRYRNQTQLLDVAREYKIRGLPISMIVIDWFHWKEMGDWQLNPTCWPDPQGMVDELRSMGIELMVTFWPYVGQARRPSPHSSRPSVSLTARSTRASTCRATGKSTIRSDSCS